MPPSMTFHTKTTNSPTRPIQPKRPWPYVQPPSYSPPQPNVSAEAEAAKANELLNLRSKNISHILAQRAALPAYSNEPIALPPENPRTEALHKELGIDKVQIVKMPFEIDTTPGGYYKSMELTQDMSDGGQGKLRDSWTPGFRDRKNTAPPRTDAVEYSGNGAVASAYVNGRLLRGGWAVD